MNTPYFEAAFTFRGALLINNLARLLALGVATRRQTTTSLSLSLSCVLPAYLILFKSLNMYYSNLCELEISSIMVLSANSKLQTRNGGGI